MEKKIKKNLVRFSRLSCLEHLNKREKNSSVFWVISGVRWFETDSLTFEDGIDR
jgi:hypothetical protein